jgi:hypothetical protein
MGADAVGLWEAEPVSGPSLVRVSFTLFRVFLSTSGAGEGGRSPVAVQWCSGGAEFAAELEVGAVEQGGVWVREQRTPEMHLMGNGRGRYFTPWSSAPLRSGLLFLGLQSVV